MLHYLPELLTLAALHFIALIVPGPDFVMITHASLKHSRRSAVFSAAGLGLGILFHVTYTLIGIGWLIARSLLFFSVLKILGAGYLFYIGWKALRAKPGPVSGEGVVERDLRPIAALKRGFLTNVLNPKASLFFLSIFSQIINPQTPLFVQAIYGLEMAVATFLWFALVAHLISHPVVRAGVQKFQHRIEQVMGAVLILFGMRLLLAKSR